MGPASIPIVRLELERMQHSILHAFMEHEVQIDSMVRDAVKRVCTKDHIQAVIDGQVRVSVDEAIKAEIENFYRYGNGRADVKAAVLKKLSKDGGY